MDGPNAASTGRIGVESRLQEQLFGKSACLPRIREGAVPERVHALGGVCALLPRLISWSIHAYSLCEGWCIPLMLLHPHVPVLDPLATPDNPNILQRSAYRMAAPDAAVSAQWRSYTDGRGDRPDGRSSEAAGRAASGGRSAELMACCGDFMYGCDIPAASTASQCRPTVSKGVQGRPRRLLPQASKISKRLWAFPQVTTFYMGVPRAGA